ncbi:hypothetical protein CCMSSC00406_0004976 [Pleurotus cornucopiae]|uniref:Uncharacterized protein n=1 Tax=Pleurotus cornucopiae TaxID=5321 RepID=A0ACB7J1E4_PLECO|nr:hypothetical protein CCMSSC00406_0004976 [Pleurotus cornucopiae]
MDNAAVPVRREQSVSQPMGTDDPEGMTPPLLSRTVRRLGIVINDDSEAALAVTGAILAQYRDRIPRRRLERQRRPDPEHESGMQHDCRDCAEARGITH